MCQVENILISLEPRHAESILVGKKLVELRRRAMHVSPGSAVWMYAKLPVGSVIGVARLEKTHTAAPSTLWRKFGRVSGISRKEFFDYFDGVRRGLALELSNVQRLPKGVALDDIREKDKNFQPPQFFARMKEGHPVLTATAAT